jgi:hypothetical protein
MPIIRTTDEALKDSEAKHNRLIKAQELNNQRNEYTINSDDYVGENPLFSYENDGKGVEDANYTFNGKADLTGDDIKGNWLFIIDVSNNKRYLVVPSVGDQTIRDNFKKYDNEFVLFIRNWFETSPENPESTEDMKKRYTTIEDLHAATKLARAEREKELQGTDPWAMVPVTEGRYDFTPNIKVYLALKKLKSETSAGGRRKKSKTNKKRKSKPRKQSRKTQKK